MFGIVFILVGFIVTRAVIVQKSTHAAIGGAGNVKAVLTNELGSSVSGGSVAVVCDGVPVSFADNGARDLDATVGTIEVTPTMGDIATTGCSTIGEALHITFSSTDGTLVTKTVDSTLIVTGVNQVTIPTIQFPLSVSVKDAFGADITADTITYNGATPTATSGATSYWASTAGSGALSVQKAGYVNASATNTGLASVSVGTANKTSVTFGNASAVSSSVAAGSAVTVQGLAPTVKLIVTDTSSNTIAIDGNLTIEKSINSGTTYSAFTPSNITTNTSYDAANPSVGSIIYRLTKAGYQTLTSSVITPVSTEQSIVSLTIAALGRSQSGGSSVTRVAATPLVIIPVTSLSDAVASSVGLEIIKNDKNDDSTKEKILNAIAQLAIPDPTVLSSTSIQWNLPANIPRRFLPANVILSRVEGEGRAARLIQIKYLVLTQNTTNWFILEDEGLEPGTEYSDRVLTIEGFPGNWAMPKATTFSEEPPILLLAPVATGVQPQILFPRPQISQQQLLAIHFLETNKYLQADGSFDSIPEWRPWYKWGFVHMSNGQRDPLNRLLYISENSVAGSQTMVVEMQREDSHEVVAGPPLVVNFSSPSLP